MRRGRCYCEIVICDLFVNVTVPNGNKKLNGYETVTATQHPGSGWVAVQLVDGAIGSGP